MSARTFTRSFAGGEIAPLLMGRLDLTKVQTGLRKCLNFRVTPQGPIENRPGFEYVIHAKGECVLIPFVYNASQSFALEFGVSTGVGYLRFHTQGGTLLESAVPITSISQASPGVFTRVAHGFSDGEWVYLSTVGGMTSLTGRWGVVVNATANTYELTDLFGVAIDTTDLPAYTGGGTASRVYEIASPYAVDDLMDLHYVQSADVLTIAHQSYQTRELRRLGATNWTFTIPSFAPTIAAPGQPTAVTGGPGGGTPADHTYVATSVADGTLEESVASQSVTASLDLTVAGNYIDLSLGAVAGSVRYNVFKQQNGIYGFIGQTDGATFRDDNITPDMSKTPPLLANPFAKGAIKTVSVTAGGTGYGGGVIDNTVVVTVGGSGYTSAPTVTALGGGGSGATFTAVLTADAVTSITVDNGGGGYVTPTLSITGGGGSGATATCTASATSTVALGVTDGTGSGAQLQPVVRGGVITGVRLVAAGQDYTAPVVTVTTGGGAGATFSTTLTGSEVNPQAVSYFEQRRCFGGSSGLPQNFWATRSGTESNMTYSIPTQDDDAITARIVAREAQSVRHLIPMGDLLALTSGGVWRLSPGSGDILTPASTAPKPQSYVGASMVQPVVTGSSILYVPDRGAHIRELGYKWQAQGYQADDVSVLAPHLFDYHSVVQLAYSTTPLQMLWAVREDGLLLGLTHQPEHEVQAWHQHDTQGLFKSVCSVPEGNEDGVYVVTNRTIGARSARFIERQRSRNFGVLADAFFVDAGMTYSGAAVSSVTGLWHLEGATVVALADGGVEPPQVVANGTFTLTSPASTVHVGLSYNCDMQTLPLALEAAQALGQGAPKNINEVWLRVQTSSGIKAGPSFDNLVPYQQRTSASPYGTPPNMLTDVIRLKLNPSWQQDGSVCVRLSDPVPLTIEAMSLEVASGG